MHLHASHQAPQKVRRVGPHVYISHLSQFIAGDLPRLELLVVPRRGGINLGSGVCCLAGQAGLGLASFSVARRTRQIGIRRALGATKPAIVRYFMLENFVVSSIGIVAGGMLAVGLNILMVQAFSLTPLAWYVIPIAMVVLWIVGQLAVAGPARKASNISPAIATRSV